MLHNPSILAEFQSSNALTLLGGLIFLFALALVLLILKSKLSPAQTPGKTPSIILLIALGAGVSLVLGVSFLYSSFKYISKTVPPPNNAIDIAVSAQRWEWSFNHPGKTMPVINNQLYVPAGRPIRLTLQSADVLHSFFIPDLDIKKDITPGQYATAWFTADKPGDYDIYCAEYCGDDHSRMRSVLHVLSYADWVKKMEDLSKFDERYSLIEYGEILYKSRGCMGCHSVDGKKITGPTFKDMFGTPVELEGGKTVMVDDAYVRKSILEPSSEIVKGYSPQMPSYKGQLTEMDITALNAYFKSISVHFKGDLEPLKRKGGPAATTQPSSQPSTQPSPKP